jgi:hypothetical protein
MSRTRTLERLRQIEQRIKQIDRELLRLCPFRNEAGRLNTERIRLRAEAARLTRGGPEA